MEVIQGGFKKGSWLHDREAYSEEEIVEMNERFKQLIERNPQYRPLFDFCLWDFKPKSEPKLVK